MHWVSVRLHETGVIRREGLEARGGGGGIISTFVKIHNKTKKKN
jgi:hypothetical protein